MSNKKYVSIKFERQDLRKDHYKGKKRYRSYISQYQHNTRQEEMDPNYLLNKDQQKDNYDFHKGVPHIEKRIEDIKKDYKDHYKRNIPSNTKPLLNGLITFSETMQEDIKKYGQNELMKHLYNFLKKEFGEVFSFSFHMDETTPHLHFGVLNYDFEKHRTRGELMNQSLKSKDNPMRQNHLQDRVAAYLQEHIKGFDYQRGIIRSVKNYHNERFKQNEHLKKQKKEIETQKLIIEELQNEINQLKTQMTHLEEEQLNTLNTIYNDLMELNEEKNASKWLKMFIRYSKNEGNEKLTKLQQKMEKIIEKRQKSTWMAKKR